MPKTKAKPSSTQRPPRAKTRAARPKASKPAASPRAGTKQEQLIALLRRPEGMTVAEACAALDWQSHTVRGAMAGALKTKLKLSITSEKPEGGERVYRIAD